MGEPLEEMAPDLVFRCHYYVESSESEENQWDGLRRGDLSTQTIAPWRVSCGFPSVIAVTGSMTSWHS